METQNEVEKVFSGVENMEKPEIPTVDPKAPTGVYARLGWAMGLIGAIAKNGYNTHFNYSYMASPDVLREVREALIHAGLVFIPNMRNVTRTGNITTVEMAFTFVDVVTGESVTMLWTGEGLDSQDKGIGKAVTSATKYFLIKTFLIPDASEPDADADGKSESKATKKNPPKQEQKAVAVVTPPSKEAYEKACLVKTPRGLDIGNLTEAQLSTLIGSKDQTFTNEQKTAAAIVQAWRKEHAG